MVKVRVPEADAVKFLNHAFGVQATAMSQLPSYDDQNFKVTGRRGGSKALQKWVMKISFRGDSAEDLELENAAMLFLAKASASSSSSSLACPTPTVLPGLNGKYIQLMPEGEGTSSGRMLMVRMVTYLDGQVMANQSKHSPLLLEDLGRVLGRMDRALASFNSPYAKRDIPWDLMKAERVARDKIGCVRGMANGEARERLVRIFLERYAKRSRQIHLSLREGVAHCDANDYNVLVSPTKPDSVAGVIDFGDLVHTKLVNNIAIAVAYAMLGKEDPITSAMHVVRGYHSEYPLLAKELASLHDLATLRLCHSVVWSAHAQKQDPDNKYISVSAKPAWECLEKLEKIPLGQPARIYASAAAAVDRERKGASSDQLSTS